MWHMKVLLISAVLFPFSISFAEPHESQKPAIRDSVEEVSTETLNFRDKLIGCKNDPLASALIPLVDLYGSELESAQKGESNIAAEVSAELKRILEGKGRRLSNANFLKALNTQNVPPGSSDKDLSTLKSLVKRTEEALTKPGNCTPSEGASNLSNLAPETLKELTDGLKAQAGKQKELSPSEGLLEKEKGRRGLGGLESLLAGLGREGQGGDGEKKGSSGSGNSGSSSGSGSGQPQSSSGSDDRENSKPSPPEREAKKEKAPQGGGGGSPAGQPSNNGNSAAKEEKKDSNQAGSSPERKMPEPSPDAKQKERAEANKEMMQQMQTQLQLQKEQEQAKAMEAEKRMAANQKAQAKRQSKRTSIPKPIEKKKKVASNGGSLKIRK